MQILNTRSTKIEVFSILYLLFMWLMQRFTNSKLIILACWAVFILVFFLNCPKTQLGQKGRMNKSVLFWAFNVSIGYILLNLGFGFVLGFGKNPASLAPSMIIENIITAFLPIIGRECIRFYVAAGSGVKHKSKLKIVSITLLLIIMEWNITGLMGLKNSAQLVQEVAQKGLPIIGTHVLLTYFCLIGGLKPALLYALLKELPYWIFPILPHLNWLAAGVFGMFFPVFAMMLLNEQYAKKVHAVKLADGKKENPISVMITSLCAILFIWFIVGVFPVYPSVIATGSMQPLINPGDVVLVDKIQDVKELETLKAGDIIQFKRDEILINHRISEVIKKDGVVTYRTKGDNNNAEDKESVESKDVKGRIIKVVPKVGWPTLLLKDTRTSEQVEF